MRLYQDASPPAQISARVVAAGVAGGTFVYANAGAWLSAAVLLLIGLAIIVTVLHLGRLTR